MTIRDDLVSELRAIVGPESKVHIVPVQDNVDELDRPAIVLKQSAISPLPGAPTGALQIDYVLTFVAPHLDAADAEVLLDDWVPSTLADLRMAWFVWTSATKVVFPPLYMAYDVAAYVIAGPTNEGTP